MSTISFYTFFADQDSPHQKDMIDHLSPLISTGQIEELSDRDILPGPDRQAQVQQKIEEADMLVCLLSASFFSRDAGLVQVVDRLSKAGRMIIPIVIRSVDFSALELHKYQTLP
ncbi:MAG: toll/interleukin-1 receptor domain-containing protein, partial [Bacteroidota bacterium]